MGGNYAPLWLCIMLLACVLGLVQNCPRRCTCSSSQPSSRYENWMMSHASQRLQWMLTGRRTSGVSGRTGRKMTCIGLRKLPHAIPMDVTRLTIYGDSKRFKRSRSQTVSTRKDWSNVVTSNPAMVYTNQLTNIDPSVLRTAKQLKELIIEGNRIKHLNATTFRESLNLTKLSLRGNELQIILPYTFQDLQRLQELDLSKNRLSFLSEISTYALSSLKTIKLSHNIIDELFNSHFNEIKNIENLDISNNRIPSISTTTFQNLTLLRMLNLANNHLHQVERDWFTKNIQLTHLNLADNERLSIIEGGSFRTLSHLQQLNLSGNRISVLDSAMLSGLKNLQLLDLSNNQLAIIESGSLQQLGDLAVFKLNGNIISHVTNDSFRGLEKLKTLEINENSIKDIGSLGLENMQNLTKLDLSHNHIDVVKTKTFKHMQNLRELHLDNNRIVELEDEAFAVSSVASMSQLGWLFLDNNNITILRERTFYGTPTLKYLGLSQNLITRINGDCFYYMRRLVTLDLETNRIRTLEGGIFTSLKSLVKLNLGSNSILKLTPAAFSGLTMLKDLFLQNNIISSIDRETFEIMPRVRQLRLSKNTLSWVDMSWFASMYDLRILDLSYNYLVEVAPTDSVPNALELLDLSDNYLNYLEQSITHSLTRSGKMRLLQNPWRCSCELGWLTSKEYRSKLELSDNEEMKCKSPGSFAGKNLSSLNPDILCGRQPVTTSSTTTRAPPTQGTERTTPTTVLQTRRTTAPSADMPMSMGPLPDMPRLLCDKIHLTNRTYRGKKLLVNWHANIVDPSTKTVVCSGVRLNENWITVTASCLTDALSIKSKTSRKYKVIIGNLVGEIKPTDPRVRYMQTTYTHPQYNDNKTSMYDMALVRLTVLPHPSPIYRESPCIMTHGDLENSINMFRIGMVTVSEKTNPSDKQWVSIVPKRAKLSPKLCSSGQYLCSRLRNTDSSKYIIVNAPTYTRYGISDADWGLSALTTSKWRISKSGKTIVRKHIPLYRYVNWYEYVMQQYERRLV